MKLTTLKDLEKDLEWKSDTLTGLKQAARDWVFVFSGEINTQNSKEHIGVNNNVVDWIKHFFNLDEIHNEEEIKNGNSWKKVGKRRNNI